MLTVFSIPKPFLGHVAVIQRNALRSWILLSKGVQVILLGDEHGIAEAARESGAEHIANIQRTEYGTPLISSAFSAAARLAKNPLLCYINGDIMLTDQLIQAITSVRKRKFVMVGRRWNVDITEPWDFSDPQWRDKLMGFVYGHGTLYIDEAIDYFVFPRDSKLINLPPFAVGRPVWDNYFLFRSRQLGYALIDATSVVTAVHQNHDYTHVPGGTGPPHLSFSPEGEANMKLLGDSSRYFTLVDATHVLTPSGLKRVRGPEYSRRWRSTYVMLHPRQKILVDGVRGVKAFLRRIGLMQRAA